jgi:DNA adenine methylase
MTTQKPFMKWVGGKTQILDVIKTKIPSSMNNYHEIFLGGASVLLMI